MHRIVDRDAGATQSRNRCGLISRPINQVGSKSEEGIGQLPGRAIFPPIQIAAQQVKKTLTIGNQPQCTWKYPGIRCRNCSACSSWPWSINTNTPAAVSNGQTFGLGTCRYC